MTLTIGSAENPTNITSFNGAFTGNITKFINNDTDTEIRPDILVYTSNS